MKPSDWDIPYGSWKIYSITDSTTIYQLTQSYENDEGGFTIKADNEFIFRSSGWCGTPPLVYVNIIGHWEEMDENLLKVSYDEYDLHFSWVMEIMEHQPYLLQIVHHYSWE